MQTLRVGCSKAEPKIFTLLQTPSRGMGQLKFNQLEKVTHYLHLQTQFGEDRCAQFRVIMVTDPQTNKPTNRQDQLQYTVLLKLAHRVLQQDTYQWKMP